MILGGDTRRRQTGLPQQVVSPVDLAVLVNSASPALGTKKFVDILRRHSVRSYRPCISRQTRYPNASPSASSTVLSHSQVQRLPCSGGDNADYLEPVLVAVTSEGDVATRLAFPAGQGITGMTKIFRKENEWMLAQCDKKYVFMMMMMMMMMMW